MEQDAQQSPYFCNSTCAEALFTPGLMTSKNDALDRVAYLFLPGKPPWQCKPTDKLADPLFG